MRNVPELFGNIRSGQAAHLYRLTGGGLEALVSDYGATLVALRYPDREGRVRDLVLGCDSAAGYENGNCYLGATVGRNANRTEGAAFSLNGKEYRLCANEGNNNLHSGPDGFSFRLWQVPAGAYTDSDVTFRLVSPDGDQGFPGKLEVTVTYRLSEDGRLELHYRARADQDTPLNLTNHSYFNLNGHDSGDVLSQWMQIEADSYTPLRDSTSIPSGEIRKVEGTPFDFRKAKRIGQEIGADDPQLLLAGGYDHNFCIRGTAGLLRKAAAAFAEESGIAMEAWTDLPGVQFYTGNFVDCSLGKEGAVYGSRSGFCLETQYFPNAVNTPGFPANILRAGESWESTTIYRFTRREH